MAEIENVPNNTPTQGSARKKRSSNWLPAEEEQLAITYLRISEDPEVGNNQAATTFHKKMEAHFNEHIKCNYRDHDQIRIKWGSLNTLTLKFSAIHNALVRNPPSGFNNAKIMATALQTYAAQNKNVAFSSLPAWEILRYSPKWRPDRPDLTIAIPTGETNASDEINIGDGSISGTGTVIRSASPSSRSASSIDRAIGGKAAKKRRLKSYSHAEMLTEASKLNSSSKERLTALKAANDILQQKNTITEEMIKIEEKKLALEERKFKVEEEHRQCETQMNEMKLLQENTDNINNPDTKQVLELMKKKIIGKWLPTS
ncbi:hypothetical protein MJO28_004587 [Puccinia striiformis f. sp. tritici]|uniref:Uncharacterized protein n=1 Tax=Puccinia striiformis f. sp. tritici TaxID=168172 RepID=A0ACC0ESW9_9BASI|nr:hypothetical protein MJO28_004587 [Puccinia striiformis f. sp. tritici]